MRNENAGLRRSVLRSSISRVAFVALSSVPVCRQPQSSSSPRMRRTSASTNDSGAAFVVEADLDNGVRLESC